MLQGRITCNPEGMCTQLSTWENITNDRKSGRNREYGVTDRTNNLCESGIKKERYELIVSSDVFLGGIYMKSKVYRALIVVGVIAILVVGEYLTVKYCYANYMDKTDPAYVSKKSGLSLKRCEVTDSSWESGFHGDGQAYFIARLSDQSAAEAKEKVRDWDALPLDTDLKLRLFGGSKEGGISFNPCEKIDVIPQITHGYYRFIDMTKTEASGSILYRELMDFSLMIYDTDNQTLYYYEYHS